MVRSASRSSRLRLSGFLTLVLAHAWSFGQVDCMASKRNRTAGFSKSTSRDLAPMDILHQRITLDLTLGNLIRGQCSIQAVPRSEGVSHLELDLAVLTVDSVIGSDGPLDFTRTQEILDIQFPSSIGTSDTVAFTVHYSGDPVTDPSGFGGFYTTPTLSYNLGVAFESVPHSYGRAWFPCLDNFTERSTYEFLVKTAGGRNAWCNGSLVERIQLNGDTVVNHWRIGETIPSYLASVAAADLTVARDTFPSLSGALVPVELIAAPGDTTGMKTSFTHLQEAFDHFETLFGPYRWEKVGYVLTPVGAMEHATSIHYPRSIATGSLQYEAVMAHELAHHWFGNLVTCDRAEEMYINEGFAEYLSFLFLEAVHGRDRYMTEVRTNHRNMVHRAHLFDEGWWALDDVPQDRTYGEHSYNKGADVLHTLRSYLGDEAFSTGLTSFLNLYAFGPVNTTLLRDHLTSVTGADLNDFFTDWIQQPGWSAFEIDDRSFTPGEDGWVVQLTIGQKQRGPADPYHNVPLTIAVVGSDVNNVHRDTVLVGGPTTSISLSVPFEPAWVWLNDDDRISLAVTGITDTVSTTAIVASDLANFELRPQFAGPPVIVRMEQYWVAPDEGTFTGPGAYFLSPDRYWRITGNWTDAGRFEARIPYDGRNSVAGNLDVGLMQDGGGSSFHEDSLVVLYRPGPEAPWMLWSDRVTTFTSPTDRTGRMELDSLLAGEYTLARRTGVVGQEEDEQATDHWTIRPNPATDHVFIDTDREGYQGILRVVDAHGKTALEHPLSGRSSQIPLKGLANGRYTLLVDGSSGTPSRIGSLVIGHR